MLGVTGVSLGLAAGSLPLTASLALAALLLLAVALTVVWRLLRSEALIAWSGGHGFSLPLVSDAGLSRLPIRPDNLLFFLGTATVVEVSWRPAHLTLSDAFFLASFGWCCFSLLRGRTATRVPTPLVLGGCLFAVGGVASTLGSPAQGQALYEVARGVWVMVLWPWTATMVLRTRRELVIATVLWSVAGTIDALGALGQSTGVSYIAGHIGLNRATGFAGGPNDLGAASATLLIPSLALALKLPARSPLGRLLQWGVVGLLAESLVASGSISAMGGALLALLIWTLSPHIRASTRAALALFLAGTLVLSSATGSAPSPVRRVQQVFAAPGSSPNAGSAQGHLNTISYAWPRIRQDPIVGAGLDRANTLVHSGVIAVWYGGGIFALAGVLLVFGAVISFGWWAAVSAPNDDDRTIIWSLVCAVAAFLVFFANQPLFWNQYGFIANALLVAWGRWVLDSRRARVGQADTEPALLSGELVPT